MKRCSTSICPARPSLSGTGRPAGTSSAAIRHAHFLGSKQGEALADIYASADVFVFPSRTDTFGMVMVEAMASGLPVAAYPVPGPIDVVGPGAGVLDEDLRAACLKALTLSREQAREHSMRFTWKRERAPVPRKYRSEPFGRQTGAPIVSGALSGPPEARQERLAPEACGYNFRARAPSKEKQEKSNKTKKISLDFLFFPWPNSWTFQ